jgi:antitoxin ParD1/3/4
MQLIAVHLPEQIVLDIEELVENGFYPNRSEAIRNAIRDLLKRELWNGRVIAHETKSEAVNQ